MKMKQREILNAIALDFARDRQEQDEYLNAKIEQIKRATKEYLMSTGMKGFMLGLSGGIDSFVAAALVADAVRDISGLVHLLILPNGEQKDIGDAKECADALTARFSNITCETVNIKPMYDGLLKSIEQSCIREHADAYFLGNAQPRLRMVCQYALGKGLLVVGTDHATENITGYFTKYGDGGSDFNPLDGLLKTDIYAIAAQYGAPACVMEKMPAAGLGISASDEAELGFTYDQLVQYLKGNLVEKDVMQRIVSLYEKAEHKRRMPASPMNLWWKEKEEEISHVVVDMIHAFTDGSMACKNADAAVKNTVAFINRNPKMRVLYVRDYHPEDHCSFKEQGGPWPAHAVAGTAESDIVEAFYRDVKKTINSPLERYNVFNKGQDPLKEEYSGFGAQNQQYGALKYNLTRKVVVSGIATEYCVKNTVMDLLKNGFEVFLLKDGLAYLEEQGHEQAIAEMQQMGAQII